VEAGDQLQSSPIYIGEGATVAHYTGGNMGFIAGLESVAKRKVPAPSRDRTQVVQMQSLVGILTELSHLI
jgi:hypothetical protein